MYSANQYVVVAESLSCVQFFSMPWTAAHRLLCPSLFPCFLELMSIELVMPSNHLILSHCLLLLSSIFPNFRFFSNESALRIRWPKYWNFSFSITSFQLIFRTDFLQYLLVWSPCCPKDSPESFPAPRFTSVNSSVLSILYGPILTSTHDY